VIFLGASEYRFPVVPVLCVYGGWALHRSLRDIRDRSGRRLTLSVAALLVLVGLVSTDIHKDILGMPNYRRETEAKALYNLAVEYQAAGLDERAIALYSESARLHPADAETQSNLGIVLARRGRLAEAITHFEKALPGLPDIASGNLRRARALLDRQVKVETPLPQTPPVSIPRRDSR
jgi:tetratricopeptide (TPR) repeat protein